MKKEIRELVDFALSDDLNQHKALVIGTVTKNQAVELELKTGINFYDCKRIIDTSAIRHIIRKHGSAKTEAKKGQVPVNIDDFEKIPQYIANAFLVEYVGKNKLKRDVFQYLSEHNGIVFIIRGVVINNDGKKLIIETMFKKKTTLVYPKFKKKQKKQTKLEQLK